MATDNPFPLDIVEKVNTPEIAAALAQFGEDKLAAAADFNKIVQALNYLNENLGGDVPGLQDILQSGNRALVFVQALDIYLDETSIYKHYFATINSSNVNLILSSQILNNVGDEVHISNVIQPFKIGKLLIPAEALEVPQIRIIHNNVGYVNTSNIEINLDHNTSYRLINVTQGLYYLFSQSVLKFENPLVYKNTTPITFTGSTVETRLFVSAPIKNMSIDSILKIEDLLFMRVGDQFADGTMTVRVRISDSEVFPGANDHNSLVMTMDCTAVYARANRTINFSHAINVNGSVIDYYYHTYQFHHEIPVYTDLGNVFRVRSNPFGQVENDKYLHVSVQLSNPALSTEFRSMLITKF